MNQTIIFIVLFVLILISTFALQSTLQKAKINKIFKFMQSGNIVAVEQELNSFSTKFLIPEFNREFIKLNIYFSEQNSQKIEQQFEVLFHLKMNAAQKKELTLKAFEYYVQLKDKEKAQSLLEELKSFEDVGMVAHAQMLYDILIDQSTNYIDLLTEKLEEGNNMDRGMNAYLISLQYSYLHNKEKEQEFLNKSKHYFSKK